MYGTITYEPGPGIDLFSHDANGIIALSLIVPIAAAIIGILCGYAIYVWIERNFEIKRKPKNTEEENEN